MSTWETSKQGWRARQVAGRAAPRGKEAAEPSQPHFRLTSAGVGSAWPGQQDLRGLAPQPPLQMGNTGSETRTQAP